MKFSFARLFFSEVFVVPESRGSFAMGRPVLVQIRRRCLRLSVLDNSA